MANEEGSYSIMRLVVLFDMPVETKEQRREYRKFHDYLEDDGFLMLQYSIYTRLCPNDTAAEKHIKRVQSFHPRYGNIRIMKITDNQFQSMIMVAGEKSAQELAEQNTSLIVI